VTPLLGKTKVVCFQRYFYVSIPTPHVMPKIWN